MEFYKLENPTLKQCFDAIINGKYTPLEMIKPRAKQLKVLLLDYWNCSELFITFQGVTNTGGVPIFFGDGEDLYDVANRTINLQEMTEEEQANEIELLGCYMVSYDTLFKLS